MEGESEKPSAQFSAFISRLSPLVFVAIVVFLIVLFWLLWGATSRFWADWAGATELNGGTVPVRTQAAGSWGDSFGGFNALVGAAGTSAVAATLYLQFLSLKEQRLDQHIERFEENFFRLVDLVRELRAGLTYVQTENFIKTESMYAMPGVQHGHDAIEAAYYEVNYWAFRAHMHSSIKRRGFIAAQYDNFVHGRYEYCFSPYFRLLYTILHKIRSDKVLNYDQKIYYANLIRAQLTSFEVGLMAFNSMSKYSKDLKSLITEFRMLKYLPLKRRKILGTIFNPVAYEPRD